MKHAVRNGVLIDEASAVLPVTRREVFFNFSVYESLKVIDGIALFVEKHIARLFESARILELQHPFGPEEVERSIHTLIDSDALGEATIKLILVGGEEPLYIVYASPLPSYPSEYYYRGVSVIRYSGERTIPRAKSNCLLLNYIAGREAERNGALEAVLVDRYGKATEGTRSNLFAVKENELVTAGDDVLYGVTRSHILETAGKLGLPLRLEKIDAGDLVNDTYSELFISSTSMGAMPIGWVDGNATGGTREAAKQHSTDTAGERRFSVTQNINTELKRLEEEYSSRG